MPQPSNRSEVPTAVLRRMLKINGVGIAVEERGEGFPILFAGDYASGMETWDRQVDRFANEFRCVRYNARGFPPSEVPARADEYSCDIVLRDFEALVDELGLDRAFYVGSSMNANLVIWAAMRRPQLCAGLVVAGGGTGYVNRPAVEQNFAKLIDSARNGRMDEFADAYANEAFLLDFKRKDPEGWQTFRDNLAALPPAGVTGNFAEILLKRPNITELKDQLAQLEVPTLLVVGDNDGSAYEPNLFLNSTIPRSGLAVLPWSGHLLNREEPEVFNALLDSFFRQARSGSL